MGRALDHVRTQVLATSQGHRLGTDTLVIVLTDGGSLEAEGTVKEAADELRSIGTRIVGETKKRRMRPSGPPTLATLPLVSLPLIITSPQPRLTQQSLASLRRSTV